MPDILIRVEMPKNCFQCPLFSNCDACEGHECECGLLGCIGYEDEISEDHRRDDCPLHELPPHGDLVDATQYRDEFMDGVYNMCADDSDNNRANAIIDLYDCAPVVVPAERREE